MIISAIKSKDVSDKRSVLHPETIKNLISKGIEIIFESGIGDGIHVGDQTFIDLGAKSVSRESCFSNAEIILTQWSLFQELRVRKKWMFSAPRQT